MNSFGKLVQSKRFMAPDGRFCSSRDEAIKYMVKEGLYTDEEIEIMEGGKKNVKGTVIVISSDHQCKNGNARFTTVSSIACLI